MPVIGYSAPSGARMTIRRAPPGRTSISQTRFVKPLGPHHCATCTGSVHALNTSARGASKMRVMTTVRSVCFALMSFLSATIPLLLFNLELAQVAAKTVEALFPEPPIVLDPVRHILERARLETRGAPLSLAAARNQAGALLHLERLGEREQASIKRLGHL